MISSMGHHAPAARPLLDNPSTTVTTTPPDPPSPTFPNEPNAAGASAKRTRFVSLAFPERSQTLPPPTPNEAASYPRPDGWPGSRAVLVGWVSRRSRRNPPGGLS